MCENYFGAFSLATIRRAFHYVSIHTKEKIQSPNTGQPNTERKKNQKYYKQGHTFLLLKKTKIHTYYGLDHDYKEKTKQKTTYCFIFCINFEFNYYDLYTLPVTFLYNLYIFRVHFRLINQRRYLNKSSNLGTDKKVSYQFFQFLLPKLSNQLSKILYLCTTRPKIS